MSYVADEIASQPDCWRRAAALAAHESVRAALPDAGARVAVIGCGTSLYMAHGMAALREAAGLGETDSYPASEFPTGREYDHVVALTRSGTTTEALQLLSRLDGRRTTAISTSTTLPVANLAGATIDLDFADERSVVQTWFATTALALWRAYLGADVGAVATEAEPLVTSELDPAMLERRQLSFLGAGWTVGLAEEAALKLREAAQVWTEAYPAMEFRHGPISVIDERSVVFFFGPPPAGLVDELAGTGGLLVISERDPMAHLVTAQRLAVALAERPGLDADAPRDLTRSIVLKS